MTESASTAKRAFDAERWPEAAALLQRVAEGETGDDQGNRQIAQYHWRSRTTGSRSIPRPSLFRQISQHKDHLKWRETLLWLTKLAMVGAAVEPEDFAPYSARPSSA